MTLHENREAFSNAIRASDHLGIRDVFVEKDYWAGIFINFHYCHQLISKCGLKLKCGFKINARL